MAKYNVETENDIIEIITKNTFSKGDIIVHKPFTFAEMQEKLKRHYSDEIKLFPARPGTPVYTINGYNTSVVEVAGTPRQPTTSP